MNKNRKYPEEEYRLTPSLWITIPLCFFVAVLIYVWLESNWQSDWPVLCMLSVICVCFLYVILQNIEYAIFNHKGILIVHTKRWGKNKTKREYYINWKDIKYIKFNILILGYLSPPAIDIASRISSNSYSHPTTLSYGKFASLAKYYSGREDIIYKRTKKRMYEKDW